MYKDIEAAKILGMDEGDIDETMSARGAGSAFNYLGEGQFRPFVPSANVVNLFEENASKLGIANPYDGAESTIDKLRNVFETLPLGGEFPNITNPLSTPLLPDIFSL